MRATRRRYLFMCIALGGNGLSPPENTLGVDSGRQGHYLLHFHFLSSLEERKTDAELAHLISPCCISEVSAGRTMPPAFQIMKNVA
jgi:hypothetical protein